MFKLRQQSKDVVLRKLRLQNVTITHESGVNAQHQYTPYFHSSSYVTLTSWRKMPRKRIVQLCVSGRRNAGNRVALWAGGGSVDRLRVGRAERQRRAGRRAGNVAISCCPSGLINSKQAKTWLRVVLWDARMYATPLAASTAEAERYPSNFSAMEQDDKLLTATVQPLNILTRK